jgi:hypothetical protein
MAIDKQKFIDQLNKDYTFNGESIIVGAAMLEGECLSGNLVKLPLKTFNRHGLIAGATGTGKTKSLQLIAEGLSKKGVPVLLMDVKGDLSGIAKAATPSDKVKERVAKIGMDYTPSDNVVEFLSLSKQPGVRLRATVSEFGPILMSKVLGLNDTQQGILALLFKYADDKSLPIIDLKDFKAMINYISNEGKDEIEKVYGAVSTNSVSTILRKVIELEQQGAEIFFGEPSFEPSDLLHKDINGRGNISIIRLTDIQDKPKLFSTFMLSLLAEIYASFPEQGDSEKPKLCLFIDEAHLIFDEASKELLDQLETTIKLIRSKGVGIFFITQNPSDIPAPILSQLGLKVQHALRAFTAIDRKAIKTAAENFPISEYYKTEDLLLSLGIGEAMVTALNEKGIPTMLTATMMAPPTSRMDVLTEEELNSNISKSELVAHYNRTIDPQSAFEILEAKLKLKLDTQPDEEEEKSKSKKEKDEPSTFEKVLKSPVTRSVGVAIAGALTRGLLGALGVKSRSTSTRRKKTSWF